MTFPQKSEFVNEDLYEPLIKGRILALQKVILEYKNSNKEDDKKMYIKAKSELKQLKKEHSQLF